MLRAAVVVIGGIMLAAAAFGGLTCWRLSAVIPLAVWGVILAGGVLFERWRYRSLMGDRPGQDWHSTQERFVDRRGRFQPTRPHGRDGQSRLNKLRTGRPFGLHRAPGPWARPVLDNIECSCAFQGSQASHGIQSEGNAPFSGRRARRGF